MSEQGAAGHTAQHNEIIIVRRHGDHEDGHHGGVWKIAFADFMTAMMAFFLVMWLTNSSEDATKKEIAKYFNPIEMNDTAPSSKGVSSDISPKPEVSNVEGPSEVKMPGEPSGNPLAGNETGGEEQALFRDPYAVLAEIAAQSTSSGSGRESGKPDGTGLPGLNGGEAYRDPFDPSSWQLSAAASVPAVPNVDAPPPELQTSVELVPADGAEPKPAEAAADPSQPAGDAGKQQAEASAIRDEIAKSLAASNQSLPSSVEVKAGPDGIVVSLADAGPSGMFEVGSAKPTGSAVSMMEKIAAVLQERQGTIVIRGHTDSRPYRSGDYDNWRLSTARAHMAYYMLARGGLDENRVKAIEGFADRDPKDAADPQAAVNRRIEILLKEPAA